MTESATHAPLAEPPEGVLEGEDVPAESAPDSYDEQLIEQAAHAIKTRGEPFTSMSDSELRERAINLLQRCGGDI